MRRMTSRFPEYTDGVLRVCEPIKAPSNFGAARNSRDVEELRVLVKLPYKLMTCREQDIEFAEAMGRALALKVQARNCPIAQTPHSVVIGDTLYSIIRLDRDSERQTMYLYLEEVRRL